MSRTGTGEVPETGAPVAASPQPETFNTVTLMSPGLGVLTELMNTCRNPTMVTEGCAPDKGVVPKSAIGIVTMELLLVITSPLFTRLACTSGLPAPACI